MDAARHARVKALFLAACEVPAGERAGFVARECGGDAALLREVASLLEHHRDDPLLADAPAGRARRDTAPLDPMDPLGLVGVTLDDRYRIEALVAEGGFSFVYRARHVRWDRPVAIKVFKVEDGRDEAWREAFVKEGALLGELSRQTTAIVQSYDVGTHAPPGRRPVVFTALEWLEGATLAETLHAERAAGAPAWPLERVLEVLEPVAEALAIAHRSGIAHRDVKPGNIFLCRGEGRRTTKLLDFGVAKVAAEHEQGFQSTGGKIKAFTVRYAAPEQLSKKHGSTGPWTDVYGLAIVCTELLLGRRPIEDDDPIGALKRFSDDAARPTPGRLGVAVSGPVEAVFERALSVDAAARQPDAGAFWRELVAAARAPAPAWWRSLRRWIGK